MAQIRNLKDNGGNVFYPLTHERAVKDSNGVTLETKLAELNSRPYDSQTPNGMGYLVLEKDKTFASQVTAANTIYEIRYDFDLGGNTFNLPANCVLQFNGGCLHNGIINGDNTSINEDVTYKIFDNVTPKKFAFSCFDIRWVGAIPGDTTIDSAPAFQKAMDMCEFYQSLPIRVIGEYKIATTVICRNHFQLYGTNFVGRYLIQALPANVRSTIIVPANVTAFHILGIVAQDGGAYCSFNIHNIYFEGNVSSSVLFKVTTSGYPGRPSVFSQCEVANFAKVFNFELNEDTIGTMLSVIAIRENNVFGCGSFIYTNQTEKMTLQNVSICNNVIEQCTGDAIVIYNPAGYIKLENNLVESNTGYILSVPSAKRQCHFEICGNYLEGSVPFMSIISDNINNNYGSVTLNSHDNYFFKGASISKYRFVLQNIIVDSIDNGYYIDDSSSFEGCYFSKTADISLLPIAALGEFNAFEKLPVADATPFLDLALKNTGVTNHDVEDTEMINRKDAFGTTTMPTYTQHPVSGTTEGNIALCLLKFGVWSGEITVNFYYGVSDNKGYKSPRPGYAIIKKEYPSGGNNNMLVSAYISTANQNSYVGVCTSVIEQNSFPNMIYVGDLSVCRNKVETAPLSLGYNKSIGTVAYNGTKKMMWNGSAWVNMDGTALS